MGNIDSIEQSNYPENLPVEYAGLAKVINISSYSEAMDGVQVGIIPPFQAVDANAAMEPRRILTGERAIATSLGIVGTFKNEEGNYGVAERIDNGNTMNPSYAMNWAGRLVPDKNGTLKPRYVRAGVVVLGVEGNRIDETPCAIFELNAEYQNWGKGELSGDQLEAMQQKGFERYLERTHVVNTSGRANLTDRTVLVAVAVEDIDCFLVMSDEDIAAIADSLVLPANDEYSKYSLRYEKPDVPGVG